MPSSSDEIKLSDPDLLELPDLPLPGDVESPESLPATESSSQPVTRLDEWPELPPLSAFVSIDGPRIEHDVDVADQPGSAGLHYAPNAMYWPEHEELARPASPSATSDLEEAPDLSSYVETEAPELPDTPLPLSLGAAEVELPEAPELSQDYGLGSTSDPFGGLDFESTEASSPILPLLREIADGVKALKPDSSLPMSSIPAGSVQLSRLFPRR